MADPDAWRKHADKPDEWREHADKHDAWSTQKQEPKMVEERLTDEERRFVLGTLITQVPRNESTQAILLRVISLFSGTDTVVVCHRAYPARTRRGPILTTRET